jgi:hypothetical protein
MSEQNGNVRTLIEQIAKALVDEPDQVVVEQVEDGPVSVLELQVAPGDMGKVIGKQGRTVRAMRALVAAAGERAQRRFNLEILEE